MVSSQARIAQLEKELEEARRELWREDAERYRILTRELPKEELDRIVDNLTNRGERILFGLEAQEEPKGKSLRPGGAGGDLACPVCGKSGLTKRGLGLHMVRLHKEEKAGKEQEAA